MGNSLIPSNAPRAPAEPRSPAARTLVAGLGNLFLGDDGFGVEVARRLREALLPRGVDVADFGIRGLHLAYELYDCEYETAILVDAAARGGAAGTVYLIDPDLPPAGGPEGAGAGVSTAPVAPDAHGMTPDAVFRMLAALGGRRPRQVLVVGCEPATVEEGIGLSEPVERGVAEAVALILDLVSKESSAEAARDPA